MSNLRVSWVAAATAAGLVAVLSDAAAAAAQNEQPAFSIPLIDLNDQPQCQVVVDREPGQYLGHPSTVLLEDGKTMLCVYPKGHGRGAIVSKRSPDGGRTWSERAGWHGQTEGVAVGEPCSHALHYRSGTCHPARQTVSV